MEPHPSTLRTWRRPLAILIVAIVVGVGAALMNRWLFSAEPLPADAVARVNAALIRRDDYERALDTLANDRRTTLDDAQRRRVLDRLIDEELLVQHALARGVLRAHGRVRSDVVAAVASIVTAEHQDAQPDATALAAFYAAQRDRFIEPGRTRIRQIFFRVAAIADAREAEARARACVERLRNGTSFTVLRDELGDPEPSPLPDALLSAAELREYLGPTVTRTVSTLAVDAVSDPIRSGTGFHVVQVVERASDAAPPLAEIQDKVLAAYRQSRSEDALRAYLDDLRRQADIEVRSAE